MMMKARMASICRLSKEILLLSSDNHLGPYGEYTDSPECVVYISHADGVRMEHFKVRWKNDVSGWTYGVLTYNCKNIEKNFVSLGRPDLDEPCAP